MLQSLFLYQQRVRVHGHEVIIGKVSRTWWNFTYVCPIQRREEKVDIADSWSGHRIVDAEAQINNITLLKASQNGNKGFVELPLRRGLKVDTNDSNDKTLLNYAEQSRSEPALRLLLGSGANLTAKYNEGRTALYFGTYYEAIVELQVGLELDINEKDKHSLTAPRRTVENSSKALLES